MQIIRKDRNYASMSIKHTIRSIVISNQSLSRRVGVVGWRLVNTGYRLKNVSEPETQASQFPFASGQMRYTCNVCGNPAEVHMPTIHREIPSCSTCGSTKRFRAIIHLLSVELFGESISLPDFPERPELRGFGMSDWSVYAEKLTTKLNYSNTFFDQVPSLDITNIDPNLEDMLDFLISSDVFEHVAHPVSRAFTNAYRLLKPGGVFIFTAPYKQFGVTEEFFPDLYDYQIIKSDDGYILYNTTKDGREEVFTDLTFHGGPGVTLAMRMFSELSLLEEFNKAGFRQIRIAREPCFEHGIYWNRVTDLPFVIRK